ncbi:efflux RND transporter periplasmic adaptor subunit [Psychroflexus aestuariivivens]|uniref:efflux RND transporter periplasmic adaptor subunit n=1 Tax=Psychroflexus aestuariivivens TaxID=1795040 RepID=UPI000FD8224A|nr:efflux RND transporter periplasmic adaptor subunit [Psychroflexus aestuariivivens]
MKNTAIFFCFLTIIIFLGCKKEKQVEAHDEHEHENEIVLTKAQFDKGDFEINRADSLVFYDEFRVTGKIDVPPEHRASVSSFFSGFVSKTHLLVGDEVKKGELLVRLKNPEFIQLQQEYVENYSALKYLSSEFERKKNLLEDRVISEKTFQKAKSDFLSMKAKVDGSRKTLELMNVDTQSVLNGNFSEEIKIYAPISGKISKVNISQGMYLEPSTLIMEILDTDHVHLELDVFEKDILKIQKGDSLVFKIPEISTKKYKGYVRLIGAEINKNRIVRIHAHPIKDSEQFSVGMFVEAYFKNNPQKKLGLPSEAFVEKEKALYVLQLKEKTENEYHFELLEVDDTQEQNRYRALESKAKLSPENQYLTKGAFDLVEGEGGGGHHH